MRYAPSPAARAPPKSAWDDPSLADHDRPLSPRGVKALLPLCDHLTHAGHRPQIVLCSSAAAPGTRSAAFAPPWRRVHGSRWTTISTEQRPKPSCGGCAAWTTASIAPCSSVTTRASRSSPTNSRVRAMRACGRSCRRSSRRPQPSRFRSTPPGETFARAVPESMICSCPTATPLTARRPGNEAVSLQPGQTPRAMLAKRV